MRRVTLRGLAARKLRLVLTALAIVLGVTFVTGTLVLGDTLNRTFDNLVGTVYQHVGFQIRGNAHSTSATRRVTAPPTASRYRSRSQASVRRLPGVEFVFGSVSGYAQLVAPQRRCDRKQRSRLGFSFDPNPQLSALRLVEGKAPATDDQVAIDKATADQVPLQRRGAGPDPAARTVTQTFTITGIVTFGSDDNLAGATLAGVPAADRAAAVQLRRAVRHDQRAGRTGRGQRHLQLEIANCCHRTSRCVSGQTVANELSQTIHNELSFLSTALLIFAFISLFVGELHDLQHVLDHGRSADPRACAAASRWSQPAAGVPIGADRGGPDRPGRFADRPRAWRCGRGWPEGVARCVRVDVAIRAARVRSSYPDRGADRRRRRDDPVSDRAGAPRRPDRTGGALWSLTRLTSPRRSGADA